MIKFNFKFKRYHTLERCNQENFVKLNLNDYFQCCIILFEVMLSKHKLLVDDTKKKKKTFVEGRSKIPIVESNIRKKYNFAPNFWTVV